MIGMRKVRSLSQCMLTFISSDVPETKRKYCRDGGERLTHSIGVAKSWISGTARSRSGPGSKILFPLRSYFSFIFFL